MAKKVIQTYNDREIYGSRIQIQFVSTAMIVKVRGCGGCGDGGGGARGRGRGRSRQWL